MNKKAYYISVLVGLLLLSLFFQNCNRFEALKNTNSNLSLDGSGDGSGNNGTDGDNGDDGNSGTNNFEFDSKAKTLIFCFNRGTSAGILKYYNVATQTFSANENTIGHCNSIVTGNFNNDSYEDFIHTNNNVSQACKLELFSGENFNLLLSQNIPGLITYDNGYSVCTATGALASDKNNDGTQDIFVKYTTSIFGNNFTALHTTPNLAQVSLTQEYNTQWSAFLNDFNDDGIEDQFSGQVRQTDASGNLSSFYIRSGADENVLLNEFQITRYNDGIAGVFELKRKNQKSYYAALSYYQANGSGQSITDTVVRILNENFEQIFSVELDAVTYSAGGGTSTSVPYYAGVADINGDGVQDLFIANRKGEYDIEYIGYNGTNGGELVRITGARLSTASGQTVSTNFGYLGSANINDDAKADLILNTWEWINNAWKLKTYFYDPIANQIIQRFDADPELQADQKWYILAKPLR